MRRVLYRFAQGNLLAGADETITVPEAVGPGYLRSVVHEPVTSTLVFGDRVSVRVGDTDAVNAFDATSNPFVAANPAGRYQLDRYVPRGSLVTIRVQRDAAVATRVAVFAVEFDHGDAAEAAMAATAAEASAGVHKASSILKMLKGR